MIIYIYRQFSRISFISSLLYIKRHKCTPRLQRINTHAFLKQLFIACCLTLPYPVFSANVPGQLIAYNCYSCHGEHLGNLYKNRSLLSKVQLKKTLLAFKYDQKKATIMNRITKGYSDSELESVSTFLRNGN